MGARTNRNNEYRYNQGLTADRDVDQSPLQRSAASVP
jgi:hypothetical protein